NYQAHKEQYCNTRPVLESIDCSSSPTPTQQLQQHQNQQHHSTAMPNQPSSPGSNNTTTAITLESESRDFITTSSFPVTSESESGFNMVPNQPLYTAPGTGLTPAGNMIMQNPSTTPESNSNSQGGNVIPTYTVMPGNEVAEFNSVPFPVSGDDVVKEEVKPMKTCEEKVAKHIPSKSPKEQSEEKAENHWI
ncbi:zinc finger protein ush, partial [Caerostris extrusa]